MQQEIRKSKLGFSLVEIMVAVTIMLFIVSGILATTLSLSKAVKSSILETDASVESVQIKRQFESDLRGVSSVSIQEANQFEFTTTDMWDNELTVSYRVDTAGSDIVLYRKEDAKAEKVVLSGAEHGLVSVNLTYYTQQGIEASSILDTNAVQIAIERDIKGPTGTIDRDVDVSMIMFRNKVYDI